MPKKERKSRSDSKLDHLKPESRVLELRDGMLAGWSHMAAMDWLLVECGVTTSGRALSSFYQKHCVPVLQERKQWAALAAAGLGKMAKETKAFEEGAIAELMEFAFQFIRNPDGDPEEKRKWFEALIKKQGSEREDKKLELQKAKQADEAKKVSDNDELTPEEKAARLKSIFGMG